MHRTLEYLTLSVIYVHLFDQVLARVHSRDLIAVLLYVHKELVALYHIIRYKLSSYFIAVYYETSTSIHFSHQGNDCRFVQSVSPNLCHWQAAGPSVEAADHADLTGLHGVSHLPLSLLVSSQVRLWL